MFATMSWPFTTLQLHFFVGQCSQGTASFITICLAGKIVDEDSHHICSHDLEDMSLHFKWDVSNVVTVFAVTYLCEWNFKFLHYFALTFHWIHDVWMHKKLSWVISFWVFFSIIIFTEFFQCILSQKY